MPGAANFTATFRNDALQIAVSAPRRKPVIVFAGLWTGGWCLTVCVLALDLLRHPDMDLEQNALRLAIWLAAGPTVGFALLWMALGQKETISIDGAAVRLDRHVGPWRRTRYIDPYSIVSIGYRKARARGWLDIAAVVRPWRGDLGRVFIDTSRRRYAFGDVLTDAEADEAVRLIRGRLAHTRTDPAAGAPAPAPSRTRSALAAAGSAILAAAVIWPAMTLPYRLALVDRSICFANDSIPPASPIDVRQFSREARLHFVGLDGIRPEQLADVAAHFRTRYRVSAVVGSADRQVDAYDSRRRQVDAGRVVAALDRMYPDRETIVVAVTDRDMFIPGFGWRYAFSYRTGGRLAVVSTARMDRGCLGLLPAGADRQAARLRKMVGKNVGVLYFKLPLSADRRSLLYAHVGGPQELDVMSEVF